MREFSGTKQHHTSLARVAAEPLPVEPSSYLRQPQRIAFRNRLYAVTPLKKRTEVEVGRGALEVGTYLSASAIRQPAAPKQIPAPQAFPLLTTDEFIQVRLATVRESTRHCYWPVDVVAKFLSADVITDSSGQ